MKGKTSILATIKSQNQLIRLIEEIPMIGNIYYNIKNNYFSINWKSEYIEIVKVNNKFTIERLKITNI